MKNFKITDTELILNDMELDALCRQYIDCELDQDEERVLVRILANKSELTDIQREVVFISGMTATADYDVNSKETQRHLNFSKIIGKIITFSMAAAVCLCFISLGWRYFQTESPDSITICEVYINGEKVEDEKISREIAFESYNENMSKIAQARALEMQYQERIKQLDNVMSRLSSDNIH